MGASQSPRYDSTLCPTHTPNSTPAPPHASQCAPLTCYTSPAPVPGVFALLPDVVHYGKGPAIRALDHVP